MVKKDTTKEQKMNTKLSTANRDLLLSIANNPSHPEYADAFRRLIEDNNR